VEWLFCDCAAGRYLDNRPSRLASHIRGWAVANGQPALVFYDGDAPFAALLLGIADARIHRVFFHADLAGLRYWDRDTVSIERHQ
jgi:hypothetical protein